MHKTIIAIAAAAATAALVAGTAGAETVKSRAFDPLTAGYQQTTGDFCIRSGWGLASSQTNRKVSNGDCRTAAEWARRGLRFNAPKVDAPIAIAAR